jgi:hypothetical protein
LICQTQLVCGTLDGACAVHSDRVPKLTVAAAVGAKVGEAFTEGFKVLQNARDMLLGSLLIGA